ncbi:hypothetical protein GF359_09925 [candidate division WOR-3 bacterium]|uniref:Uncharacterized protein n=1 Tax=candidate division WOR-3 bacterium TaxID=2052148 RepID=A0A9D5QD98_UNCW3|nr:hypothetical protein [candidate division WOR-3 bacterium]MBD3365518.1 hypothetical protein [candidate division WOR-3 bacterium]
MIERRFVPWTYFLVILFITGCGSSSDSLTPPELTQEPYFRNEYLCLAWDNVCKDQEGFQGYNVYISTDSSAVGLTGTDSCLSEAKVRTRIGKDDDTVTVKCRELPDGRWLDEIDSFWVHIRNVHNDTVGPGDRQYLVYPEGSQVIQPVRNISYEIISDKDGNPGGGIKLSWDKPLSTLNPDAYVVYCRGLNEDVNDTVGITEYLLYTPTGRMEVTALYGGDLSRSASVSLGSVYSGEFELWNIDESDTTLPNGFGFDGTSIGYYSISQQDDWQDIDFYIASGADLASSQNHEPPLNNRNGLISDELIHGGFYGRDSVPPATQSNYTSVKDVKGYGNTYALWIDYTNNGYSADDRFGKIEIIYIEMNKVTLQLAFQPIQGLRWVTFD